MGGLDSNGRECSRTWVHVLVDSVMYAPLVWIKSCLIICVSRIGFIWDSWHFTKSITSRKTYSLWVWSCSKLEEDSEKLPIFWIRCSDSNLETCEGLGFSGCFRSIAIQTCWWSHCPWQIREELTTGPLHAIEIAREVRTLIIIVHFVLIHGFWYKTSPHFTWHFGECVCVCARARQSSPLWSEHAFLFFYFYFLYFEWGVSFFYKRTSSQYCCYVFIRLSVMELQLWLP